MSTQKRTRCGRKKKCVKEAKGRIFFYTSKYFLLEFPSRKLFWVMKAECCRLGPQRG